MSLLEMQNGNWKRPFFIIWSGQLFSLLGSQLVQFALVWWITKTTGSAMLLATSSIVAILPDVFLGPFAGALVDRWNRRKVMMIADSMIAFTTFCLGILFFCNLIQTWHVFVVLFLRSLGGCFHWPAMQASTSLMVPEKHLARISGLNSSVRGALNIAAPPLGALLLSIIPIYGIIGVDVVTAMIAIFPLFFILIPQPTKDNPSAVVTPKILLGDVKSGLKYVWAWPGLMAIIIYAVLINFLINPPFTLLPLLVTNHFHGTAMDFGFLDSMFGIGIVLGGIILTAWGGFRKKIYTSLLGILGLGIGVFLVGVAPSSLFGLALAGMFLGGLMNPITNGPLMAIVQAKVDPDMQGRVFTLISSFSAAMTPIGMLCAGPVAEAFGIQFWFIVGSIICIALAISAFFIPAVIHIEDNHIDHGLKSQEHPMKVTGIV